MAQSVTEPKMKWSTPPPKRTGVGSKNRGGRTMRFVEALKARPNRWAIYTEGVSNAVSVTMGKKRFPNTEWTSRKQADGTFTVYARYIGK